MRISSGGGEVLPCGGRPIAPRLRSGRRLGTLAAAAAIVLLAGCAEKSLFGVESPDLSYWKGYYHDARNGLRRPSQWERRDWLVLAGLVAATAGIQTQDEHIRDAVLESQNAGTEDLAFYSEKAGRWENLLLGSAVLYGLGYAFDDPKLKEVSLLGAESVLLSGFLATRVLKHLVGRERPLLGTGPDEFHGPSMHEDWDSWPSGHTTVAFAMATAFHLEYRNKWVSLLAYSLAALSGWSRIHDDWHWASDVFAGAVVGIVTTKVVFRARGRRSDTVAGRWGR